MTTTVGGASVRMTREKYSDEDRGEAFGFHLMLDCYACLPDKLDSIDACVEFLDDLVEEIGAERQTQPYVFRTPMQFSGKEGLSGWVPIVESGISLHTLTKTRFVSLDVYSCREFDTDRIVAFTERLFGPSEIDAVFVLRGKRWQQCR